MGTNPYRMLRKVITSLTPKYHKLKDKSVFLVLFGISFVIRFPFFFRDYIDRDESTFILMGQSWVDGHLPYTELWDLKPPITFLFFASSIYVFGKSFLAIRCLGSILVAITAFFTYKIGAATGSKKLGLWAALACVALQSLFGSLQGVMSEHICMAFFMPGLFLLTRAKKSIEVLFSGLLMGLAIMTKLNMAYPSLLLGIYFLYVHIKSGKLGRTILFALCYGGGALLVIGLTLLPYLITDRVEVWWKSVILAPLEYTDARRYSFFKMSPTFLIIAAFIIFAWKKKFLDFTSITIQALLVAMVGVLFSFIQGGRINGHYLIQLYPMLIVLVGLALSKIRMPLKVNLTPYLLIPCFLIPMESYLEYGAIVRNKEKHGTYFNGEGFTVPRFLSKNGQDTQNILFLGYHIGYWVLDAKPPTMAATHPSNISRDELFPFYDNPRKTSLEEVRHIMEEIRPQTVVIRKNKSIFDGREVEQNNYMARYLKEYYTLSASVDMAEIFQRLE